MALKERRVRDILRGGNEEIITIRFDGEDLIRLPCYCKYDPALCGEGGNGNEVMLIRRIDVRNADGSWDPYPSVTWLDGVESEEQLVTRVLIKKTNEEGFCTMSSSQGVPDAKLMSAAEEAGVYVKIIDG